MLFLSEGLIRFRVPVPEEVSLDAAIALIADELDLMGGKASIAHIPLGRRIVYGRLRDDPTKKEQLTLLIVFDETRPLAEAELFLHAKTVDDDSPELPSRKDELTRRHLPLEDW